MEKERPRPGARGSSFSIMHEGRSLTRRQALKEIRAIFLVSFTPIACVPRTILMIRFVLILMFEAMAQNRDSGSCEQALGTMGTYPRTMGTCLGTMGT
jgi:hypothetical protein